MSEQAVFDALRCRIDIDVFGTRRYYNNAGQLHRTNGPAIEWADGDNFWYQNGQLHRTDGAAIEYSDRAKSWYINGDKVWYINGVELTESEFNQKVKAL